jgi:hypothetical protein
MRLHVKVFLFFLFFSFTWRRRDAGPRECSHFKKIFFLINENIHVAPHGCAST